jgi:hypothetical protein
MSVSTKISIITNMCMRCNIVKMHVCIEYTDFPVLSSFMTNCVCVARVTRRVPPVERKLLTLPEHMSSSPVLVGFVLLNL